MIQLSTAKIKINIGNITVEIEAPMEKIEEAVRNTIAAIKTAEPQPPVKKPAVQRKPVTCKRAVLELVESGWMNNGRTLSEVATELERRGFSYDTTAVAHVLLDLVRENVLERIGEPRSYLYVVKGMTLKTSQISSDDSTT
ncbi:MAG: hypothetical protein NZ956_02470 [Candidatus Caldarchaeum sp.]|nr:hypothetical protein [Candidatus Caldarchaeum sp.]